MSNVGISLEQIERALIATADHEAAHCIVGAVAGFDVRSVSIRPKGGRAGRAMVRGLDLGAWDADFFTPRDDQSGERVINKGRIDLCLSGVRRERMGLSKDELTRLVRAELCVSLAGHAMDGRAFFDEQQVYPDGDDFDHASIYLQWLRYFGDYRPVKYFIDDVVLDAIMFFETHLENLSDALLSKSYIRGRELSRMLPKPWEGWPR